MPTEIPTVFVVDDDVAVRRSVSRLLRTAGYCTEVAESAAEFLRQATAAVHPCCAVLDVRLPDLDGLDLQVRLGAHGVLMPIVFITGHGDVPMSVRAMKAGAIDFLLKPFDPRHLLDIVRIAIERDRGEIVDRENLKHTLALMARLTPREREVMDLVVAGLLNKQIAERLGTAEQTVKIHRGRVMHKLGVGSVADLVRLVG